MPLSQILFSELKHEASNTKMDMTTVDVVKFKDGKAVEHWSYMDPKDMMKMMPPVGKMDSKK